MEKLSRRQQRLLAIARKNRREIIEARLTRAELIKLGLLTSAGYLIRKKGLSARAAFADGGSPTSPPTRPFMDPLPIMPVKKSVAFLTDPSNGLRLDPTVSPNKGEGRTQNHQSTNNPFPPQKLYQVVQQQAKVRMSSDPNLPEQTIWGFDGMSPGPTYFAKYGEPVLVRNVNGLPIDNGGFGMPSVTTHLHNGHTPSESDGNPLDFFERGFFYDQHYPNVLAGFTDPQFKDTVGDPREAMSTLWYHDHREMFTAQNTYKGLAGFYLLFNDQDTGDEGTGFHLPSFPNFDIPMLFADKVFDPDTGLLFFDMFNFDGILGDKFLVNGKIQPFLHVSPRRYRFRWLDSGPSRFYEIYITDLNNLSAVNRFWQISNDGNLLPKPIQVTSVRLGVAERADVIIDFSGFAGKTIYLENRLEQTDGRQPTGNILPAGQGNLILQIIVDGPAVPDNSQDPATITKFYDLPPADPSKAVVTRQFEFNRGNGMWTINSQLMDRQPRFTIKQNTAEVWLLQNSSGGWTHPAHNHFEEFQILTRNGLPPSGVEVSRKDMIMVANEQDAVFFRFRDFHGRYPLHCHNVLHEDHAMMLLWVIDPDVGDQNPQP